MDAKTPPLVTIWIPVYNGADLVWRAIESAIHQNYKNLEILVFDDCSTDNTKEVVVRYTQKDSRVRYYNSGSRLGFRQSLPTIYKNAKGDFTLFLAHDDWLSRDYVEECMQIFDANPDMGVVTGRNFSVVERSGVISLEREADISSGIYTRDWFGKNAYKNFLHSMIFLGVVRRKDALGVSEFMNRFGSNPPQELPEELRELLKHEYVADILFPVPLLTKYPRLAVAKNAAYLKTELPTEHYVARKGSMGLRAKYGIDNDTAKGILKRYIYNRWAYEVLFENGWREYISKMRIFFGKETLGTMLSEWMKHRFSRVFFRDLGIGDLKNLFERYSFFEVAMSFILVPPRLLQRYVFWFCRRLFPKRLPDVYTRNYFLNREKQFTVEE